MMTHEALNDDRDETCEHARFSVEDFCAVTYASSQDPSQYVAVRGGRVVSE